MNFSSLVVSAPAKVILHGEHSVVYGKVALAASLGLRTTLTWEKSSEDKVELHLNDLGFSSSWTITQLVQHLPSFPEGDFRCIEEDLMDKIYIFKKFLQDNEKGISNISFSAALAFLFLYKAIYGKIGSFLPGKFVLKSDVPIGAGLGSSASFSVVVAATLLLTSGVVPPQSVSKTTIMQNSSNNDSLNIINKWAFEGEKIMHGSPSGIDNTVSTFGGFLKFQSGKMENLERVPGLNVFLVNTNVPRSTKIMVGGLRERYEEMPDIFEPVFTAMGKITMECIKVLGQLSDLSTSSLPGSDERNHCFQRLEKLFDLNQGLLKTVGVSHSCIDNVCETTLKHGFHSKLTGAGGGGCVITLINEACKSNTPKQLREVLKNLGYDCWETKLGELGVFLHEWS